jgi:uncharacterized LabA/DUF88 family protein
MSTKENISLWKNRFVARKLSGMKVDDWCEKNNVSRHAYYYWHHKIQNVQEQVEKIFAEIPMASTIATPNLNEVVTSGLVINWRNFSISVAKSVDIPMVADLMQRLVEHNRQQ